MPSIARLDDASLSRDDLAAASFLASYREPTRSNYALSLRQWFNWCSARGITPLTASRAHIEVWAREMEERQGLKPSTIANKLNALTSFYRLAMRDKVIAENPTDYLRRPTVPRVTTTNALTRRELLAILDWARDESDDLQAHALLCLLGLNGPRIGEALRLDVEDLGEQGSYLGIKLYREKGNRSGFVALAPRTSKALEAHIGSRASGPLFRMKQGHNMGERMDDKAANRIVQRARSALGIERRITCHSFRHTYVTLACDSGVPMRDIQHAMGYADGTRMVAYYDHGSPNLARDPTHSISAYVELA